MTLTSAHNTCVMQLNSHSVWHCVYVWQCVESQHVQKSGVILTDGLPKVLIIMLIQTFSILCVYNASEHISKCNSHTSNTQTYTVWHYIGLSRGTAHWCSTMHCGWQLKYMSTVSQALWGYSSWLDTDITYQQHTATVHCKLQVIYTQQFHKHHR